MMQLRSLLTIVSATLLWVDSADAQTNPFKAYTALKTPKRDVPVGAVWIPGYGPNGAGAPASNLIVSPGATSLAITDDMRQQAAISIGSFLGLDASKAGKLNVQLGNIEIHRVADLSKVGAGSGKQILFEAVKAGTISIVADTQTALALKAKATARNITASIDGTGGSKSSLTLNGSDLFLFYQVVELRPTKPSEQRRRHQGKPITFDNTYQFDFCECGPGRRVEVYVTNLATPDLNGNFSRQTFAFNQGPGSWISIPIIAHMKGNKLSAAMAKVGFNSGTSCNNSVQVNGGPLCFQTWPSADNYVTLNKSVITIAPVKKPSTTY